MSIDVPMMSLRMVADSRVEIPYDRLSTSADAAAVAVALLRDRPVEHLIAIMIDGRARITGVATVAIGGMHGAAVSARDVLRAVLMSHGAAFILAHNHPSGDPTPSPEDIAFTRQIEAAAEIIGVRMLDHVVVVSSGDFRTVLA